MSLIKTTALNAISMLIKILTQLGLSKVLAIYIGPTGFALLGQFQNFVQVFVQLSGGLLNTGITKYTAEYEHDDKMQQSLWRSTGSVLFAGSMISCVFIFFLRKYLAIHLMHNEQYSFIFGWFACSILLMAFNAFLLAILNGKQLFSKYVTANILGSLLSFIISALLVIYAGIYGCLIATVINSSISFFVTFFVCLRLPWFRLSNFFGKFDKHNFRLLLKFAIMSLTTILCIPATQFLIRNYLGVHISWASAGCWEAMTRISNIYLMFITNTLAVYYLPKLSSLKNSFEIKMEVIEGYKWILPLAIAAAVLMYLLRDIIINILLSSSFLSIRELFGWQLIGDTFKIASFLIAYIYVAKGHIKLYIFSEIFFSLLYFILTVLLVNKFGLRGAAMSYAMTYLSYLFFVFLSLKSYFFLTKWGGSLKNVPLSFH